MTRFVFTAALVLLACSSPSKSGTGPVGTQGALSSIAVTPTAPAIAKGATQSFTAAGAYSDGAIRDLTAQATWSSSTTGVATIDAAGLATGTGAGNTTITASVGSVIGNTTLTVTATVAPGAPAITTASLPDGTQNVAYSATLAAAGGTPPYSWSFSSGALPPGLSINATGAITGTPTAAGTSVFTARVTDAASASATQALSIAIAAAQTYTYTLWPLSSVPATMDGGDPSPVELGVTFGSDVDGSVTGIRFYKAAANIGTHVGHLWSGSGTLLATATFTTETNSGWQEVSLSTPVQITANTLYVASYRTDVGHYSADYDYFAGKGRSNPPLNAPADSPLDIPAVHNGVFGDVGTFPNLSFRQSNYWVDVVFSTTATPGTTPAVPEPSGWYAGDMHAHRSCGGDPASVSSIYQLMAPQNLAAISLLADMGNGEVQDPTTDLPLVNGQQDDPVSTSGRIVHWDAEWHWDPIYWQYPHQALGGHLVVLGVSEAHQIWEEYTSPIFDWAHSKGGLAGFAHMQYLDDTIPQTLSCCGPIEYPVEVALGKSDFISEDVVAGDSSFGGMNPEAAVQAYYRLLNTGFRPGFAAGTDHPCDNGSELGTLLTYVQVAGGQMNYRNWIDGIAKGRTVVSRNGHNEFLNLVVNGNATPGDEVKLASAGSVPVTVQWTANQSLSGTIEIVSNGVVVASKQATVAAGAPVSLSAKVNFAKSGWLAARRMNGNGHQVHTSAVFVTVDNAPVRVSVADANFYVQWMDNLLEKTSPGGAWSSYFPTNLAAAQSRYQAAKVVYQQIASEAAAPP